MKKSLLSIAIIAALPFGAMAENISGAMYTTPSTADTNHPAPTTNAVAPYGRANIDTADQEHIATTAYVKGAYNSAIAAVNFLNERKQNVLHNSDANTDINTVWGAGDFLSLIQSGDLHEFANDPSTESIVLSAPAVARAMDAQRVDIYTTWDTSATQQVPLSFVPVQP